MPSMNKLTIGKLSVRRGNKGVKSLSQAKRRRISIKMESTKDFGGRLTSINLESLIRDLTSPKHLPRQLG